MAAGGVGTTNAAVAGALPDEPRWTYDGEATPEPGRRSVLDVSYEVIDGGLVEQRLFVTDGHGVHEYVRDDVQSDCPGSDPRSRSAESRATRWSSHGSRATSASGRVSNEVDRVEISPIGGCTSRCFTSSKTATFATMLEVGEDLISVSAYGDDGERLPDRRRHHPELPNSGGPDTTYPAASD